MRITCLVLSEETRSYLAKTGQKTSTELSLRDFGSTPRCSTGLQYALHEEEVPKYKGKLADAIVTLDVTKISSFGVGDLRLSGRIVEVRAMGSGK